jgi:hypothetical protein
MLLLHKGAAVRGGQDHPGVGQNFLAANREQGFLLAPDVREWLPERPFA